MARPTRSTLRSVRVASGRLTTQYIDSANGRINNGTGVNGQVNYSYLGCEYGSGSMCYYDSNGRSTIAPYGARTAAFNWCAFDSLLPH